MSVDLRIASLLIVLLIFSSCSNSSNERVDNNLNLNPGRQTNPNPSGQVCFPEVSLMRREFSPTNSALNGIVGGDRVLQTAIDANRVVMLFDTDGAICTAIPIAPDVLLTAAHCTQGNLKKYLAVFYTSLSCESGFDARNTKVVTTVKEFIIHEDYIDSASITEMKGDLALVFLTKDIPANYPIYRIANPNSVNSSNTLKFFGYGAVGYQLRGSGMLRRTELPSTHYRIDQENLKVHVDQSIGRGVCSGDSGGPGFVEINGELQVLGVNSYVSTTDASKDACKDSAVMVLVDSYRDWIELKLAARNRYLKQ